MPHDLSPAVERLAESLASHTRPLAQATWWELLLADDEGKPWTLLQSAGQDPQAVLRLAVEYAKGEVLPGELYEIARQKAIFLRSDTNISTDVLLLALLELDAQFAAVLQTHGFAVEKLEALLMQVHSSPQATLADPGPELMIVESSASVEAARIVDVNLNRARESLRILDDYCRFVRNDRLLTAEVKQLRHDLVAAATLLPARPLLAARNTPGDVGTGIGTASEYERQSALQVAQVNMKRLQESLRSLEEFGKILAENFAHAVEQIRYRAYSLEQPILGQPSQARLAEAKLYALLTGSQCVAALDWTIAEIAQGGVDIVQLREKTLSDAELLERAKNVRRWTREAGVLFIVNDRPDIALLAQADGVHLGQDDLPVAAARRILGPDAIIGVSTHNLAQVHQAILDGADYLGVGPTFPSRTKSFEAFPGLDFVREVAAATSLPAFALGGIDGQNIGQVVAAGLHRVAVSSVLAEADEPQGIARQLRWALSQ
jgi:thiamine-phosphate pyrophosphorylase